MKKLFMIIIPIFLFGFYASYQRGYKNAFKSFDSYKQGIVDQAIEDNSPPECHATNCPEYTFFDADGDGLNESVVTEYTTMTQQAGRIWIIDNGKVVFKSEEKAQISVSPVSKSGENNGFVIGYNTTYQLSPTFLDSFKHDYYEHKDGKYILEKTESK